MRLQRYLLIAIGGALGSAARYEVGALAAQRFGMRFPVGTLVINISVCILIGFSVEFLNRHVNINPRLALSHSRWIYRGVLHVLDIRVGDLEGLHFRSVLDWPALHDGEPCSRPRQAAFGLSQGQK